MSPLCASKTIDARSVFRGRGLLFTGLALVAGIQSWAAENRLPKKYLDASKAVAVTGETPFSPSSVREGEFIKIKAGEWSACRRPAAHLRPRAAADDPVEDFLESRSSLKNLSLMEAKGLLSSRVRKQPWSGDYWSYSQGLLGARYADSDFLRLTDWFTRFAFIGENPMDRLLETMGQDGIQHLGPAEKYDLLVGDKKRALTKSMWEQGKVYYDSDGKVEDWMGLCHGWAPAAMMEPRPTKSVDALSFDTKWKIPLNPSEIKGLVSYSWATNPYDVAFLGQRCTKKDPKRDDNGRLIDPECFDLNPATWHRVVVNQVGARKQPFIMDATYDYEVWNQPVAAYSYTYFNPQTMAPVASLELAKVARAEFTRDVFSKYRSAKVSAVAGINMVVAYVVETRATTAETDSEGRDVLRWVGYQYDLELDADGDVIGGEWYDPVHPDFVWMPRRDARPESPLDPLIKDTAWSVNGPVPANWAEAAWRSSEYGLMLHSIPEALLERTMDSH